MLADVLHVFSLSCSWPEVVLWVASSDTDADVFVYLEDYDPVADVARYVTEGHFRASHRREHIAPPPGDPRAASHIPGRHASRSAVLRRRSLLDQCQAVRPAHRGTRLSDSFRTADESVLVHDT